MNQEGGPYRGQSGLLQATEHNIVFSVTTGTLLILQHFQFKISQEIAHFRYTGIKQ